MNDTRAYLIHTDDEYFEEDFPNGYMDFDHKDHEAAYSYRIFNESYLRKILSNRSEPLTKASYILLELDKTYGEPKDAALITDKDYPKARSDGELHLQ